MSAPSKAAPAPSIVLSTETRLSQYDWETLSGDLNGYGCAVLEKLLSPDECRRIAELYPEEEHFPSAASPIRARRGARCASHGTREGDDGGLAFGGTVEIAHAVNLQTEIQPGQRRESGCSPR
jgi:hypothetical protein